MNISSPTQDGGSGGNSDERFQELFRRFYASVTYFFRNRGFPREESRDLAQETFMRAYRRWGSFRWESRFETWLFRIATHVAINALRHQQAEKRSSDELSLEEALENGLPVFGKDRLFDGHREPEALGSILDEERTVQLRTALDELPPRMRECVLLRLNHGLRYREIAALTGVSIETVKAQLFQARRQLRDPLRWWDDPRVRIKPAKGLASFAGF